MVKAPNKTMRIAITADPFIPVPPTNYGGIERIIHFLAEGLEKSEHEVILVAHEESTAQVELVKYPKLESGLGGHLKNIATINKIKKWKPDVIHSFSRLAYLLPFFRSNIPKLMSYQREPTLSQIKKAVAFSKNDSISFTGCSDYISNQIKPFAPSYTVYNGVDIEIYDFVDEVSADAPLIFLGRIEPIKGPQEAIAAALATGKNLIIAGNIPNEHADFFNTEIKPFLGKQIEYVGPVNDQQKNKLLGSAAAFLMPIFWNEPFGIVMAEAMACGTPVIGYPRGAVTEVVTHGLDGFLAQDFEELCSSILKIPEISRVKTRTTAEKKFSSKKIVDDYISIYKKISHR
jgi:glycosyltransferase involved in cell wall biosynthesis